MLQVGKQKTSDSLLADRLLANQHVLTCQFTFLCLSGKKVSFGVENISLPSRVAPLIVLVVERSKFSYLYASKCLAEETMMPIREL